MRWIVAVRAPGPDPVVGETIELTDDGAYVSYGEAGVLIRTGYDALGGYSSERLIPWPMVMDYREEKKA